MEIQSFVFGILVMSSLFMIATFVIGIVKIYRMKLEIQLARDDLKSAFEELQNLHNKLDTEIKSVTSYIDSRIDKVLRK
jgi:biopolymer transport protein ExbB/TolQ